MEICLIVSLSVANASIKFQCESKNARQHRDEEQLTGLSCPCSSRPPMQTWEQEGKFEEAKSSSATLAQRSV